MSVHVATTVNVPSVKDITIILPGRFFFFYNKYRFLSLGNTSWPGLGLLVGVADAVIGKHSNAGAKRMLSFGTFRMDRIWRKTVNFHHILQHGLEIDVEVFKQTILEVEYHAVNDRELIIAIALLDNGCLDDILAGFYHIQLDQSIVSCVLVLDLVEFLLVQAIDVSDVSKPRIEYSQVGRR